MAYVQNFLLHEVALTGLQFQAGSSKSLEDWLSVPDVAKRRSQKQLYFIQVD